jgi:hypothetical protein
MTFQEFFANLPGGTLIRTVDHKFYVKIHDLEGCKSMVVVDRLYGHVHHINELFGPEDDASRWTFEHIGVKFFYVEGVNLLTSEELQTLNDVKLGMPIIELRKSCSTLRANTPVICETQHVIASATSPMGHDYLIVRPR